MAEFKQFALPDVGEGLTEADILKWFVQPGDEVEVNQTIVEIETAKAAVELPCPYSGVVTQLHVEEGNTVAVGATIITIDVDPAGSGAAPSDPLPAAATVERASPDEPVEPGLIGGPAPGGRTSVLVGYGPRTTEAVRRPRRREATGGGPTPSAHPMFAQPPVRAAAVAEAHPVAPPPVATALVTAAPAAGAEVGGASAMPATPPVLAKPPVRKYARDLGVELASVTPTGPNGVITREDVAAAAAAVAAVAGVGTVTGAEGGGVREERIPVRGVRKHTAAAMVTSAFTAPHVTEFLTVDVTRTMQMRDRVAALPEFAGVKVSPLLFLARALLLAVRRHPMVNSTWDEERGEIVVKHYVNLGIAAATPRGLIVPNIKDADRLSLRELAVALGELAETARAGHSSPADLTGGSITITNVGVFGVDTGTPILNPGEAAIVAFGAVRPMPWVVDGAVVPRQVTQLAMSFDHRIIDGELGSRFLADLGALMHDPDLFLAWS